MTAVSLTAISERALDAAAAHLRAGRLVAFPTETVYGLGANACDGAAVAGIYAAKGRPRFNPLIVHVTSVAAAMCLAVFDDASERLAERFWPGPLTLVLPARPSNGIADLTTAGLDTIAIRVPSHPIALDLIARAGVPVAAPSANRSGHVSATTADHVRSDLGGDVAMILDGGATVHGLESTIVALLAGGAHLLRPGAVPREAIAAVLGRAVLDGSRPATPDAPIAPGQLASHYAPAARVRLDATDVQPGEALLAFGPNPLPATGPVFNLSPRGDLVEAAANLFTALRALDAAGAGAITAMPIPDTGLGEAINDRLRRAAAPRG